ncbi:DUF2948 family protein [Aestuariispira insulae]|uniref:DUF2948 family protein n=1 Tax=Aestuariispira insulae TaxID=1461337 RepID=A0A3D9HK97_9PROT|nr:DUF2948 family protein [Aestuariispira insulae]RED49893.1 hypothetical protein DFP90_105266 [Aestuariispira insulae]
MTAEHKPIRLLAKDLEDMTVLSSMLQDALVPLSDVQYAAQDQTFILVLNRFCWEDVRAGKHTEPYRRVLSGLRFDHVRSVAFRGIDRNENDRVLELLTIAYCDGGPDADGNCNIVLHFSGGGAIRLTVSGLACAMEDMGESWPTRWKPGHENEGTGG